MSDDAGVQRYVELVKGLSPTQRLVLQSVAKGRNNEGVAEDLGVPEGTITSRLVAIYARLGLTHAGVGRKEKRKIVGGMFNAFLQEYAIDAHGFVMVRPKHEPMQPAAITNGNGSTPAARPHMEPPSHNGAAVPKSATAPLQVPKAVPGYGSGVSVELSDPETIEEIEMVQVGQPGSRERMRALKSEGFRVEIANHFQSFTSGRGFVTAIFVKRSA